MTTSGSATFNPAFDVIIEEAFERAGTELRSGYDLKSARRSLDIMSAEWSNRGLNLWTVVQGTIPLIMGTATYVLPADTIDIIEQTIRSGTGTSQTDLDIERVGVTQYASIVSKNQTGRPSQVYVERLTAPQVTFWPIPDVSSTYTFVYWRMRRMQDTGAATNTADIPARFIPALVSGLAYYVALKRPALESRVPMLKGIYDEQFQLAYTEDRDRGSFFVVPYIW